MGEQHKRVNIKNCIFQRQANQKLTQAQILKEKEMQEEMKRIDEKQKNKINPRKVKFVLSDILKEKADLSCVLNYNLNSSRSSPDSSLK